MTGRYDAVVLAGGAASRLGGADKPALPVGERSLLDRVLDACGDADTTVVVGPRRSTARPVRWTREEPPGGGPLPALAAGIAELRAAHCSLPDNLPGRPGVVLVLASDLPFLTAATVRALASAVGPVLRRNGEREPYGDDGAGADHGGQETGRAGEAGEEDGDEGGHQEGEAEQDGAMLTDPTGRDQLLAAAYRIEPLEREVALLTTEYGTLTGLPLRLLAGGLRLRRIADPTGEASFDCDTWEDVAVARARLATRPER